MDITSYHTIFFLTRSDGESDHWHRISYSIGLGLGTYRAYHIIISLGLRYRMIGYMIEKRRNRSMNNPSVREVFIMIIIFAFLSLFRVILFGRTIIEL